MVIFAGSNATTAPLRRISLNCAKRGSALLATGLPASPTIRSLGGAAAEEEATEEGVIRMNSAPDRGLLGCCSWTASLGIPHADRRDLPGSSPRKLAPDLRVRTPRGAREAPNVTSR